MPLFNVHFVIQTEAQNSKLSKTFLTKYLQILFCQNTQKPFLGDAFFRKTYFYFL